MSEENVVPISVTSTKFYITCEFEGGEIFEYKFENRENFYHLDGTLADSEEDKSDEEILRSRIFSAFINFYNNNRQRPRRLEVSECESSVREFITNPPTLLKDPNSSTYLHISKLKRTIITKEVSEYIVEIKIKIDNKNATSFSIVSLTKVV